MPESARSPEQSRLNLPGRAGDPLSIRPGALLLASGGDRVRAVGDRRDAASRERLLRRVEMEYAEMPGLSLTMAQARRLFVLRDDICVRVLRTLVSSGVLRCNDKGAFVFSGYRSSTEAAGARRPE